MKIFTCTWHYLSSALIVSALAFAGLSSAAFADSGRTWAVYAFDLTGKPGKDSVLFEAELTQMLAEGSGSSGMRADMRRDSNGYRLASADERTCMQDPIS